jgi:hypothetical protein
MACLSRREGTIMAATTRLGIAVALFGLIGCAGTPIYNVTYDASYVPGETRANGPDVTVVVRGNPSSLSKAEFDRTVTDAMQGWGFGPIRFTPDGNPNTAYRVVMIFNPSPNTGGYVLCTRPLAADAVAGGGAPGRLPLVAALCRGDSYMSLAEGAIGAADGPQGGEFRNGIGLVTAALFPASNPQRRGGPECAMC